MPSKSHLLLWSLIYTHQGLEYFGATTLREYKLIQSEAIQVSSLPEEKDGISDQRARTRLIVPCSVRHCKSKLAILNGAWAIAIWYSTICNDPNVQLNKGIIDNNRAGLKGTCAYFMGSLGMNVYVGRPLK